MHYATNASAGIVMNTGTFTIRVVPNELNLNYDGLIVHMTDYGFAKARQVINPTNPCLRVP